MENVIKIPIQGDRVDACGITITPFDVLIKSYKDKVGQPCVATMEGNPSVVIQMVVKEVREFPDREKYAEVILEYGVNAMQTN